MAVAITGDGAGGGAGGKVFGRSDPGHRTVLDAAKGAPMVRNPERAVAVLGHSLDRPGRQAVGEDSEGAVVEKQEVTGFNADGQAAVAGLDDGAETLVFVVGGEGAGWKIFEMMAIEPGHARRHGEPEVAVGGLGDADDVVVGQAVFGLPDAERPRDVSRGGRQ